VVHKGDRTPAGGNMAVGTFSCCHYMIGGF
jgi:hypothetical protein